MHHLCYALLAWAAAASATQAAPPIVIPDSVDLTTPSIFNAGDIQLTVYQEPSLSDPTSIFFDYSFDELLAPPRVELSFDNFARNADEGSDWWIVREGSVVGPVGASFPFDPPSIDGVILQSGLTLPLDSPLLTVTQPVFGYKASLFLGFSTVESGGFSPRTIFGWVELELPRFRDGFSQPTILRSATAFNSGGIIVGSLTTVPEPSGAALFFTGVIAGAWRRRRG